MTNQNGIITISSGYFVILDGCHASGGVHYDRDQISERETIDGGMEKEYKTTKRVDHVELCKRADAIVSSARYAIKKRATHTALGWVADREAVKAIRDEIAGVKREAALFNDHARANRCARRVTISVVAHEIRPDEGDVYEWSRQIAATVREALAWVFAESQAVVANWDAYANEKEARKAIDRIGVALRTKCKNLPQLATGMQRFALIDALDDAAKAVKAMRAALKESKGAPTIDLDSVESAIGLYVDLDHDDDDRGELAEAVA